MQLTFDSDVEEFRAEFAAFLNVSAIHPACRWLILPGRRPRECSLRCSNRVGDRRQLRRCFPQVAGADDVATVEHGSRATPSAASFGGLLSAPLYFCTE